MENKKVVNIYAEICREGVLLPEYAHAFDAGMDICAACDIDIFPGETELIPTGLKFAIPEGYEIQIRPRSGISLNTPLRLPNAPGTIDAGYRDEICVIMSNTSPVQDSEKSVLLPLCSKGNIPGPYHISRGDRIAQMVLAEVPKTSFTLCESISEIGNNRGGGFGSSGIK